MQVENVKQKRVTLKTIAENAGLSVTAVSQILNNKTVDFCSEANKSRVRKLARELGYRPNVGVKIMRGEPLKSVATVLSMNQMELDDHIQRIILTLFKRYEQLDYSCYFCSGEHNAGQNMRRIQKLLDYGVERFIFIGHPFGMEKLDREIRRYGRMTVYYETLPLPAGYAGVYSDTAGAVCEMIELWRREGYKNIAFFQLAVDPDEQRFLGLCRAFPEYDRTTLQKKMLHLLPFDIRHSVNFFTESRLCGQQAAERLLAECPDVDAIFLYSDAFAVGAAPVLLEHYRQTGRRIALAGFNYTHAAQSCIYPILSAEHPLEQIVAALMQESASAVFPQIVKPEIRKPDQYQSTSSTKKEVKKCQENSH